MKRWIALVLLLICLAPPARAREATEQREEIAGRTAYILDYDWDLLPEWNAREYLEAPGTVAALYCDSASADALISLVPRDAAANASDYLLTQARNDMGAMVVGETVGPELIREADRLLDTVGRVYHIPMERIHLCAGGAAIDRWNDPLPAAVRARAASCDAILFGSIGAAKYNALPPEKNPARALLELRSVFGVTTNLRPVRLRPEQIDISPLKPEIIPGGFDILLVRDVRGGMLAAREQRHAVGKCGQSASDLEYYDERIVMHTARRAFEAASQRTGRLISLDKANVLASSVLWRQTVTRLAAEYPKVALEHRFIDTAAMDVIRAPQDFDVILTGNVFGDILADELAQPPSLAVRSLPRTGGGCIL